MIKELHGTSSAAISTELLRLRRASGSPTQGMVLTLIVVCEASEFAAACDASAAAGREHPSRILVVVSSSDPEPGLDAEIHLGEDMPGEMVVIRMRGAVADHPASVIRPLLLPDSPVVIWWPGRAPTDQAADELAQLTLRRLTDAAAATDPGAALRDRAAHYSPGDTDLSWTRLTPWRALLAAALDQYPSTVTAVRLEAEPGNPSAELLVAWLADRLGVPVEPAASGGPGITAVRLVTDSGDIAVTRPDGRLAAYAVPGQPERKVALKRRGTTDLITEELRRMDADPVYAATLQALADGGHR